MCPEQDFSVFEKCLSVSLSVSAKTFVQTVTRELMHRDDIGVIFVDVDQSGHYYTVFIYFYINSKKKCYHRNSRLSVFDVLHTLGRLEDNLTLSRKRLFVCVSLWA